MTTVLSDHRVKARKHHQCFHCYRHIAPGQTYRRTGLVNDGQAYTIRTHDDCEALFEYFLKDSGTRWFDYGDDGHPPIADIWADDGVSQVMCDRYRGYFPHAITRIESWFREKERSHD